MSKKTEDFFFSNFIESASISCEAAELLKEILCEFDINHLDEYLNKMQVIEDRGDATKHKMIHELVRAFITPIERDDIIKLSQKLDDVIDAIEDILIHIYINNIKEIREDSIVFASLLIRCCYTTKEALEEFRNFKKSKKLNELIIEINHMEEEGDKLYIGSMRKLHLTTKDPLTVIAWRNIYEFFEGCCDTCEDVADIIEGIAIGNT